MKPATRSLLTIIALALSVVGCGARHTLAVVDTNIKMFLKALLLTGSALLVGCSGDGEDLNGIQSSSPSIPSTGDQGLNGGLTGRLITTYQFQPYEFDLSSGAATALPIVSSFDFYQDRPDTENASKWNFFAAGDEFPNQGYVETLYNCLILPTGSCLSVYDSNFQVVKRVRVADRILEEPAKLSPSGRQAVMCS